MTYIPNLTYIVAPDHKDLTSEFRATLGYIPEVFEEGCIIRGEEPYRNIDSVKVYEVPTLKEAHREVFLKRGVAISDQRPFLFIVRSSPTVM